MDKRNVLWISGISWLRNDNTFFPDVTYPGIVSGSAFQQSIIEGLETQGYNISILSDCDMATGKRIEWSHNGSSNDIRVAGKQNKFLRIPTKILNLLKEIEKGKIIRKIDYVIAYEMHFPYLICLSRIKKLNPKIKTVLICPDLSMYMDLNLRKNHIKAFLKKVEEKWSRNLLKKVDGHVLFTHQMNDYFSAYQKPYTVVEGVYGNKNSLEDVKKDNYIMHAGSLHYNIGIEELVEAFEQISNSKVELWFFGSGAMDEYIKSKAKENSRIKHKGFVEPKQLFEYEKKAILLVNVRDPKYDYTKYSFPSKTFEYLASKTPYLSTDLPGIPNEYKEYMITIKDNSVAEVKKGLEYVLSMDEKLRNDIGERARNFVLQKKNKIIQSKKIADFLGTLE